MLPQASTDKTTPDPPYQSKFSDSLDALSQRSWGRAGAYRAPWALGDCSGAGNERFRLVVLGDNAFRWRVRGYRSLMVLVLMVLHNFMAG